MSFRFLVLSGIVSLAFVSSAQAGSPVAPAEIVTLVPRDEWHDLFEGIESSREQRHEEAKKLLGNASQDPHSSVLACGLALRLNAFVTAGNKALSADPDRQSAGTRIFLTAFHWMRNYSGQLSHASLAVERWLWRRAANALRRRRWRPGSSGARVMLRWRRQSILGCSRSWGRNADSARGAAPSATTLELLDSRPMSGWKRAVTGMAGRARLDEQRKARILDSIAVAQSYLARAKESVATHGADEAAWNLTKTGRAAT